ncbi:hypothetical protein BDV11DRAFT_172178 [Aspergillus similis]
MSTPKRHGGGFIPTAKTSFSFAGRSTIDESSTGNGNYLCPQNESTHGSTLPSSHDSKTTKPHGGGFNPSTTNNTKMPSLSTTAQQQPQISPSAGVEMTTVPLPQAKSSSVKHGGGYVPKNHLQDNGGRVPAVSTSNYVPAQMHGEISQNTADNGHTSNRVEGALDGDAERSSRRRHGGGYVPRGPA